MFSLPQNKYNAIIVLLISMPPLRQKINALDWFDLIPVNTSFLELYLKSYFWRDFITAKQFVLN